MKVSRLFNLRKKLLLYSTEMNLVFAHHIVVVDVLPDHQCICQSTSLSHHFYISAFIESDTLSTFFLVSGHLNVETLSTTTKEQMAPLVQMIVINLIICCRKAEDPYLRGKQKNRSLSKKFQVFQIFIPKENSVPDHDYSLFNPTSFQLHSVY